MLNQVILVGKVMKVNKYEHLESNVVIKIESADRVDVIAFILPDTLADQTIEYLKEGAMIGIKAYLKGDTEYLQIIAEKITFINSAT